MTEEPAALGQACAMLQTCVKGGKDLSMCLEAFPLFLPTLNSFYWVKAALTSHNHKSSEISSS